MPENKSLADVGADVGAGAGVEGEAALAGFDAS